MRVAVIAITKNGKEIAKKIKMSMDCDIFMPKKFADDSNITFYDEPTPLILGKLFNSYDALVCIFSLGATIRMIANHLKDKRVDPAVLVIDDRANFVISALSGHLGGANELARSIANILNAMPVITTAAEVNNTIAVDLLGKEYNWEIEGEENVTKVSADMVNNEPIGVYQDAGEKEWQKDLPKNVRVFNSLDELKRSDSKSYLIITDCIIEDEEILARSVIYRPKSLVVGLGLHYDTSKEMIEYGIEDTFKRYKLSLRSIRRLATIDKGLKIKGLEEYAKDNNLIIEYYPRDELSKIKVPNPSSVVAKYEGTASVAEASALLASKGVLIVEKQIYPPNLTIAVARLDYG